MTRNTGIPLNVRFVEELHVDEAAATIRASEISSRSALTPEAEVVWLLQAIRSMDLTTLSEDDTDDRVRELCERAKRPVDKALAETLTIDAESVTVGAVCVYHQFARTAAAALHGSGIPVAAVAGGFPVGLADHGRRLEEIHRGVADGAGEIDAVITRTHVLEERWDALYDEIRSFREACGDSRLKVILATGDLGSLTNVARASHVAMMAGADFIKTSTGREAVNATLPVGVVMATAIRAYWEETGHAVGLKPAGGIRTASSAIDWLLLVDRELGDDWRRPSRFRIGASGLLADILQHLERGASDE